MKNLKKYCKIYIDTKKPLTTLLADDRFTKENMLATIAESIFDDENSKWWIIAAKNSSDSNTIDLSLETTSDILDSESCSSDKTLIDTMARMIKSICE